MKPDWLADREVPIVLTHAVIAQNNIPVMIIQKMPEPFSEINNLITCWFIQNFTCITFYSASVIKFDINQACGAIGNLKLTYPSSGWQNY